MLTPCSRRRRRAVAEDQPGHRLGRVGVQAGQDMVGTAMILTGYVLGRRSGRVVP
jgi:hypothetical protein